MKSVMITAAAAAGIFISASTAAQAQDCAFDPEVDFFDYEQVDLDRLYDCVKDRLAEGYAAEGDEVAVAYRDWGVTATGAAAPGAHSNRMLLTFANDVAYDQYVQYAFGDFEMPVGSILAKESYSVNKKGEPRLGPLFIMTKVEAGGEAEEFDNWVYAAVRTNGKPMGIKQGFCHGCHEAYADQDSLGYPDRDVRFETN